MRKPTDGVVTFPYGATSPPYSKSNPHAGTDYGARQGDNIYAPHAGKVVAAGWMGTCGYGIDIDSGNRFKSRLCHNSQLLVSVGQTVGEGQVVAKAGETGTFDDGSKAAFGVHSHWVLWDNGTRVNGALYVSESPEGEDMTIDDALARRLLALGLFLAVEGSDAPDRQPAAKEIEDAVGRDAVEYIDYLMNTSPWKRNWLHVKYYDKDVAESGNVKPYQGPQLFIKG